MILDGSFADAQGCSDFFVAATFGNKLNNSFSRTLSTDAESFPEGRRVLLSICSYSRSEKPYVALGRVRREPEFFQHPT
jgi:hypothetical protein